MNLLTILLGLLGMLLLYFTIHLVVNRGKIRFTYLATALLYSFAVGVPVAYYNNFPEKLRPSLYILYYALFLLPYFGIEVYNCVRKRQTWTRFILIFSGMVLILVSPFIEVPERVFLIGLGLIFVTAFFIHLFRYPHMNVMWLMDTALKAAENIEKNCKYSPKPVVLPIPSKKTHCAGAAGLFLLFKKNSAIVRLSKKFHDKLGNPNMEQYAAELVRRIKGKMKESGDIPGTDSA